MLSLNMIICEAHDALFADGPLSFELMLSPELSLPIKPRWSPVKNVSEAAYEKIIFAMVPHRTAGMHCAVALHSLR